MPRYYFHLADTSERILDPDGVELACDKTAILEATEAVKEVLDEDHGRASWSGWCLQVVAEGDRVVGSIELGQVRPH
jgi:hypothetical protein